MEMLRLQSTSNTTTPNQSHLWISPANYTHFCQSRYFYFAHIMHHCLHSMLILTHLNHLASRCYSNSLKDTFQPADNCHTQPDGAGLAQLALSHPVSAMGLA